jgi:hypothetical protein
MDINTIKLGDDGTPCECPRCHADEGELCICNDDGYECLKCGLWFDALDDGTPRFVYNSHPLML